MKGREFEMQEYLHNMLAERAQLKAQVHELEIQLEIARQMLPPAATLARPA